MEPFALYMTRNKPKWYHIRGISIGGKFKGKAGWVTDTSFKQVGLACKNLMSCF